MTTSSHITKEAVAEVSNLATTFGLALAEHEIDNPALVYSLVKIALNIGDAEYRRGLADGGTIVDNVLKGLKDGAAN